MQKAVDCNCLQPQWFCVFGTGEKVIKREACSPRFGCLFQTNLWFLTVVFSGHVCSYSPCSLFQLSFSTQIFASGLLCSFPSTLSSPLSPLSCIIAWSEASPKLSFLRRALVISQLPNLEKMRGGNVVPDS